MADDVAKEIIEKLASIGADVRHIHEKSSAMDNKLDTLTVRDAQREMTVKAAHQRIDDIAADIKEEIKPMVNNHENFQNKALGIIGFVGFVCTGFGAAIVYFFQKIFDHGGN